MTFLEFTLWLAETNTSYSSWYQKPLQILFVKVSREKAGKLYSQQLAIYNFDLRKLNEDAFCVALKGLADEFDHHVRSVT